MLLDYGTLRLIWWALLGVLLIGFAIMDGFDLGVAMLHPFVPKNENQRRVLLNTIGPVWEGNQVWFILGGGAVFAAWPLLYAASFSGFYLAMMLVLLGLILRPVALTFRGKMEFSCLAPKLGLGVLHLRSRSVAGVRRRFRKFAAGNTVPFRQVVATRL